MSEGIDSVNSKKNHRRTRSESSIMNGEIESQFSEGNSTPTKNLLENGFSLTKRTSFSQGSSPISNSKLNGKEVIEEKEEDKSEKSFEKEKEEDLEKQKQKEKVDEVIYLDASEAEEKEEEKEEKEHEEEELEEEEEEEEDHGQLFILDQEKLQQLSQDLNQKTADLSIKDLLNLKSKLHRLIFQDRYSTDKTKLLSQLNDELLNFLDHSKKKCTLLE